MKKLSFLAFAAFLGTFIYSHYKLMNVTPFKKIGLSNFSLFPNEMQREAENISKTEKQKINLSRVNRNIAYSEIVLNKKTGKEEIKTYVPKGMRLYDEEKMKEISKDVPVETFYQQ